MIKWRHKSLFFPNGLKLRRVLDFVNNYLLQCQESEGRKKNHDFGTIFSIFKFSNFWIFRKRFWYELIQMFLICYQYYDTLKTDLKPAVTLRILFDMLLKLDIVLLSKNKVILS